MNCSCVALEWLWGDTPRPRAEKPQQDCRCYSAGCTVLERLSEDTPCQRAKEKPQQDGKRGKIAFRIKPHTCQRRSEVSNKPSAHQDPETPQRLRQNCVWVSPLEDDAVKVLHSMCQQIWKTQQWPQDWKRSVFIPVSNKGNAKECSNYRTIVLISHASKIMLKILQERLQQFLNCELADVQAGFRKGKRTREKVANIHWIMEKVREFQKNIYFCFIDYAKAFIGSQ